MSTLIGMTGSRRGVDGKVAEGGRRRRAGRGPVGTEGLSRAERKEQTRGAILTAARRVLGRDGFAGTTTRKVAEEAGVAVGTVFLHFPDTASLVDALLDEHLAHALEGAFRSLPKRGGLVKQLVHVARTLFDSYDVEPDLSRAYIAGSLFATRGERLGSARLASFEAWVGGRIAESVERGEVRAIDPQVAFMTFFSLYFGVLVGGLRGAMERKEQCRVLEAALREFFREESRS